VFLHLRNTRTGLEIIFGPPAIVGAEGLQLQLPEAGRAARPRRRRGKQKVSKDETESGNGRGAPRPDDLEVDGLTVVRRSHRGGTACPTAAPGLSPLIGPNGRANPVSTRARPGTPFGWWAERQDVTRLPRRGAGADRLRPAFQQMEPFDSLSVLGQRSSASGGAYGGVYSRWSPSAANAAGLPSPGRCSCGLTGLEDAAGALSTGQRRLSSGALSRNPFSVPPSTSPRPGLTTGRRRFGQILKGSSPNGVGILLVEHDMALVWTLR
jgi:hypothetical protein